MKLSLADALHFTNLWLPLLDFTNKKLKVSTRLSDITDISKKYNLGEMKKLVPIFFENLGIIDEYLDQEKRLSNEDKNIVLSWKRAVRGPFFWERDLTKGSVFINLYNGEKKVYIVNGIFASMSEMFCSQRPPLPVLIDLLPFKDEIVFVGWPKFFSTYLPINVADIYRKIYMLAKESKLFITKL